MKISRELEAKLLAMPGVVVGGATRLPTAGESPLAPLLAAKIGERQFTHNVLDLARDHGWRTAHFRTSRTKDGGWTTAVAGDGKGFLDLLLIRERLIVAELKVGKNTLSKEQKEWIAAWRATGVEPFVWRPGDWSEIVKELTRRE